MTTPCPSLTSGAITQNCPGMDWKLKGSVLLTSKRRGAATASPRMIVPQRGRNSAASTRCCSRVRRIGGRVFLIISGLIIARVVSLVIIVVRLDLYVVENDAKDICTDIHQLLFSAAHDGARAAPAMDYQNHSVYDCRKDRSVRERDRRRGINHDMREFLAERSQQAAHFIRAEQFGGIWRYRARRQQL